MIRLCESCSDKYPIHEFCKACYKKAIAQAKLEAYADCFDEIQLRHPSEVYLYLKKKLAELKGGENG